MTTSRVHMFEAVDRMDAEGWAAFLAPDVLFRYGNNDPIYGRDACRRALDALFSRINGIAHHVVEQWEHGDTTIVEAHITYTRRDGRGVQVPMATIYRTGAHDLIADYRVYIDPTPVLAD